jgi:hypothetical protein
MLYLSSSWLDLRKVYVPKNVRERVCVCGCVNMLWRKGSELLTVSEIQEHDRVILSEFQRAQHCIESFTTNQKNFGRLINTSASGMREKERVIWYVEWGREGERERLPAVAFSTRNTFRGLAPSNKHNQSKLHINWETNLVLKNNQ